MIIPRQFLSIKTTLNMPYKNHPIGKIPTRYDRLPATKKRRVTISIEHHTGKNIYFLVVDLPKGGNDNVIITEEQAESLSAKFKIDITNIR